MITGRWEAAVAYQELKRNTIVCVHFIHSWSRWRHTQVHAQMGSRSPVLHNRILPDNGSPLFLRCFLLHTLSNPFTRMPDGAQWGASFTFFCTKNSTLYSLIHGKRMLFFLPLVSFQTHTDTVGSLTSDVPRLKYTRMAFKEPAVGFLSFSSLRWWVTTCTAHFRAHRRILCWLALL